MKISPVTVAIFLCALAVHAEESKFIGTFESVSLFAGLPGGDSARSKELAETMKQTLVITGRDLTLKMGVGGGLYMTYTVHENFILGKTVVGATEMFYPIYAKDADTLFVAGQKLVRVKETRK